MRVSLPRFSLSYVQNSGALFHGLNRVDLSASVTFTCNFPAASQVMGRIPTIVIRKYIC